MKCKCGYEGPAEIGEFRDKDVPWTVHYKCPECKTVNTLKIKYIESFDRIRAVLLYPEKCQGVKGETEEHAPVDKVVEFITGGADLNTVGYGIGCPVCQWGTGSAISKEEFEKLKKLYPDKIVVKDCAEEMAKIYKKVRK